MALSILDSDVDLEPDEHAALRARALSDVRDLRALGRATPSVNNVIVAFSLPMLGLYHGALRGLVLGRLNVARSATARAERGVRNSSNSASSARPDSSSTWSSSRCCRRSSRPRCNRAVLRRSTRSRFCRRRLELLPQPRSGRSARRGHAGAKALQFMTVSRDRARRRLDRSSRWLEPVGSHSVTATTWFVATVAGIFVNFFVNKYWTFRVGRLTRRGARMPWWIAVAAFCLHRPGCCGSKASTTRCSIIRAGAKAIPPRSRATSRAAVQHFYPQTEYNGAPPELRRAGIADRAVSRPRRLQDLRRARNLRPADRDGVRRRHDRRVAG